MEKKWVLSTVCILLIFLIAVGTCYGEESGPENLRIIRGNINYDGSKDSGEGFTSSRQMSYPKGVYRITPTASFSSKPTIVITPIASANRLTFGWWIGGDSYFEVGITARGNGTYADSPFSFIIVGPQ